MSASAEVELEATGEVVMVDVRARRFALRVEGGPELEGLFDPSQERTLLDAFVRHQEVRIMVTGRGFAPDDDERRCHFSRVDSIQLREQLATAGQPGPASGLAKAFEEIMAGVPDEELERIPPADRIDEVLYGTTPRAK